MSSGKPGSARIGERDPGGCDGVFKYMRDDANVRKGDARLEMYRAGGGDSTSTVFGDL